MELFHGLILDRTCPLTCPSIGGAGFKSNAASFNFDSPGCKVPSDNLPAWSHASIPPAFGGPGASDYDFMAGFGLKVGAYPVGDCLRGVLGGVWPAVELALKPSDGTGGNKRIVEAAEFC